MENQLNPISISVLVILVLTLLNLGLVILALRRLNGLRKDLRTPVVKKFNSEFKRKSMDIHKTPEIFNKIQREDRHGKSGNQQSSQQNRQKGNQQRPMPRRPVAKIPDVFSNEASAPQASVPVPPHPIAAESPVVEGRRPLQPRSNAVAKVEVPVAPDPIPAAPVNFAASDSGEEAGMEFDRSKMAHGRRNVVAKPVIEDDAEGNV